MFDVPSSALAGAAVSAIALAGMVDGLTKALPLPSATGVSIEASCRRIAQVFAPRVRSSAAVGAIAAELVKNVQTLARGANPSDASAALYDLAQRCTGAVPVSASPVLTRAYSLAQSLATGIEAACLGEAFLAEARTSFGDRQAASAARDRINAAMDGASDRIAAALGQVSLEIVATAARQSCAYLVDQTTSLQPVVRVQAGRSFPAMSLAWSLYSDPSRAPELLARARCGTPFFMPATFEAVAPKRKT